MRNKQRMRRKVKAIAGNSRSKILQEQNQVRNDSCRRLADEAGEMMRESFVRAGEIDGLIKRCKKQRAFLRRKGRQYEADQLTNLIGQLSQSFIEERDEKNRHLQKARYLNNTHRTCSSR